MELLNRPTGLLGVDYAEAQQRELKLKFRLRVRARIVVESVAKYLGRTEELHLLDLGSADGKALCEMSRLLPRSEILGIEYTPELVELAAGLSPNIRILRGDIRDLPVEVAARQFDVVSALAVLEHLESPAEVVGKVSQNLKPGGIFVASVPVPRWERAAQRLGLRRWDVHHCTLDRERMVAAVNAAGLHLLEYRKFMWAPVAGLTYLRIPVSPAFSLGIDRVISLLRIANGMFVNHAVIARKAA